jgi:hypothetical protein
VSFAINPSAFISRRNTFIAMMKATILDASAKTAFLSFATAAVGRVVAAGAAYALAQANPARFIDPIGLSGQVSADGGFAATKASRWAFRFR